MECLIKGNRYFTPNGDPSTLHKELVDLVGEESANELFILSYTPDFQSQVVTPLKNRYKQEVFRKLDQIPSAQLKTKIVEKNGFRTIQALDDKGKVVGYIRMKPFTDGFQVDSVNTSEKGKGIGVQLYKEAIRDNFRRDMAMYADAQQTEDAQKVWKKLIDFTTEKNNRKQVSNLQDSYFYKSGEVRAEQVLQYASNSNRTQSELSFVEEQQIKTVLGDFADTQELLDTLTPAFYNNGFFNPTRDGLKKTGFYNDYEINKILSSPQVLADIKTTLEKIQNSENIENPAYKGNEKFEGSTEELTVLGKLTPVNPFRAEQDYIQEFGGRMEMADEMLLEEDNFIRIPKITEEGEPLTDRIIYEDAVKQVEPKTLEKLSALLSAPQNILRGDSAKKVLRKVESELANVGIDTPNLELHLDLLPSLFDFAVDPNVENTQAFEAKYREVYDKPQMQKEAVLQNEFEEKYDLVFLETNRSEQDLFDNQSLVATSIPNVYHRVEKVDAQSLIDYVNNKDNIKRGKRKTPIITQRDLFNNSKLQESKRAFESYSDLRLPLSATYEELDDLFESIYFGEILDNLPYNLIEEDYGVKESDIRNLIGRYEKVLNRSETPNLQITTELDAYKEYFGHPKQRPQAKVKEVQYDAYEPLSDDFIADFAAEIIKNKDSEFYNSFQITEKGIELKYNDPLTLDTIKSYIKDGVKLGKEIEQYSLLAKHMPNLKTVEKVESKEIRRLEAVNNWQDVETPNGIFTQLNQELLAVEDTNQEFVRVGEEVYELQEQVGDTFFFSRLNKNNNLNYLILAPQAQPMYQIPSTIKKEAQQKFRKLFKTDENFDCL